MNRFLEIVPAQLQAFLVFAACALVALPAAAQPRASIMAPPTLNNGQMETPFIYLQDGNEFEYRITHTRDGESIDPAFLRFTVTAIQAPVAGVDDYFVLVQTYSEDRLIRQAQCYTREQRGRIHLMGASNMGMSDCNWQSPFSQQDMNMVGEATAIQVGGQTVPVDSTARYEHFWGDQNGDNGFISFRYAAGIGLYHFESRTTDSPMEPDAAMVEWVGDLQYARIGDEEFGVSIVKERFERSDVVPELTPAQ